MKYTKRLVEFTRVWESGYSNNPNDRGKETLNGISRVYHPNWKGWKLVDILKEGVNSLEELDKAVQTITLQNLTDDFYKQWWSDHHCDEMPEIIDTIFFDNSFMSGKAVWLLQRSINFFNRFTFEEEYFKDIKIAEDNIWGKYTRDELNEVDTSTIRINLEDILIYKRGKYQNHLQNERRFEQGWASRTFNLGLYIKSNLNPDMIK